MNRGNRVIKGFFFALLLTFVAGTLLVGCSGGGSEIVSNRDNVSSTEEASGQETQSEDTVASDEAAGLEDASDEARESDTSTESSIESAEEKESSLLHEGVKAKIFDFQDTLNYISKTEGTPLTIDYSEEKYLPLSRNAAASPDHKKPKNIEEKAFDDELKRLQVTRSDNGATLDFQVYTNPDTELIDKIVSIEYGSIGREVTGYFFEDSTLVYAYRYNDNLYGTKSKEGMEKGGIRCFFDKDSMAECFLTQNGKNDSYVAKDYDKMNEETRGEYDHLEKELINRAYLTYDLVANTPATARIYGYVMDEQGGMLKNAKVTIISGANNYNAETEVNDDGYYQIIVPINQLDWYNLKFQYGDFAPVEVDDINIRPMTLTYSAGVTYMGPAGSTSHPTATYLLDITKQSPDKLGDDEYEVVLSYENQDADLKPFLMNLSTGEIQSDTTMIFKADKDKKYRYFLTDQRGGRSNDKMTYEMSLSGATLKVYNRDGLQASFQVPLAAAGVVWEAFSVEGGKIIPVDNYYMDVGKEIFFE
ncbi:MAG: carboxypeptidase-like regulatory domain-containing protein [Lachnospiraceae bacterium]|nr:carboxypeptidase-like regulatory domain-containing protein [Lachnospiraceae bacterium]